MSANTRSTPKPTRRSPASSARAALLGKGSPRLRLGALIFAALWALLIWLIYPYALSIAAWQSNARYLGLALLLIVVIATYKLVANLALVIRHIGLLWLGSVVLVLFLGATLAQGRAQGASDWSGWRRAAGQVASSAGQSIGRFSEELAGAPANIYMAASGKTPFWRAPAAAAVEPVVLSRRAEQDQLVLSSEQEPSEITSGVIVAAMSRDGSTITMQATPGQRATAVGEVESGTLMVVVGGPRRADGQIWWQVSDQQRIGWCSGDALALVSR